MKLTVESLRNRSEWESAGIRIPCYDVSALQQRTLEKPRWVHFGIGAVRATLGKYLDT